MPEQPLVVVAVATAKPGMAGRLRAALEQLVADALEEDGCIAYRLHQSREDAAVLVFVETWRDHAAWRAHMDGEAVRRFGATDSDELMADLQIHQLDAIAG